MSDLDRQVFKLIILHNKLLSEKDLNFFFTKHTTPEQCIERLVVSNMIPQEVGAKLLQVYKSKLAKEKERLAIADSVGGMDDDPEELDEPVPMDDPQEDAMDSGGSSYGLAGDVGEAADLNKADEVGWGDQAAANHEENMAHHVDDSEKIDLSDEITPQKLVKGFEDSSRLGASKGESLPKFGRASLTAHTPASVLAQDSDDPDDIDEHFRSPVPPGQIDPMALKLLKKGVKLGCSDIHLSAGSPPFFRLNGSLAYTELPPLTPEQANVMALGFMDEKQQQQFLRTHDIDFSLDFPGIGRFRVNALQQFRGPSIIFRYIPKEIPTLEKLGLPKTLASFTEYHQGLVLVTGPAGCGKTTTAAAMIDLINESRNDHIITVEDPVEFLHPSKGCNVTQRQVPVHTDSFATALKASLREDPDVIMIGEM